MTPPATPLARQYHKGNVAEDLLAVARRLLDSERIEDLSVRRLTREVGVTPANFYNHFPSLNDLLLEIAADGFVERARMLGHIRRTSKTRAEALKRGAVAFVEFAVAHHQTFRLMFGGIPDAHLHTRFTQASDAAFGQLMELIYGQNLHDPGDVATSRRRGRIGYGVLAMNYGIARMVVENQWEFKSDDPAELRAFVEGVVDAFIQGELGRVLS